MASSWSQSWGRSWGNSWGRVSTTSTPSEPGGISSTYRNFYSGAYEGKRGKKRQVEVMIREIENDDEDLLILVKQFLEATC